MTMKRKSVYSSLPSKILIIVTAGNAKMVANVLMASIITANPVTLSVRLLASTSTAKLAKVMKILTVHSLIGTQILISEMVGSVTTAANASMALTKMAKNVTSFVPTVLIRMPNLV